MSLLGFTALVFFAVTGITLNHPTWFGVETQRITTHEGDLKLEWLKGSTPVSSDTSAVPEVAKLEIVEHLREKWRLRGTVSEFRADEHECLILFKGPGYSADTVINCESGHYTITETVMGVVAVINDLHKGRDTGIVWSWIIDITAALMVFVSVTGIVLIFYLKRKRFSGIVTAVVGTILFAVIYVIWVP